MNAIDLFSGAGGLTRATCDSGFNIVLSNEVNPVFAKTHDYNFPSIPMVIDDINNLTTEVINEYVKGQEIDLVEGGPPCQGFSIFGKRRFVNTQGYDPKQDPRNFLVCSIAGMQFTIPGAGLGVSGAALGTAAAETVVAGSIYQDSKRKLNQSFFFMENVKGIYKFR